MLTGTGTQDSVVVDQRLIHDDGYLSDLNRKPSCHWVTQVNWSGFTVYPGVDHSQLLYPCHGDTVTYLSVLAIKEND